METFTNKQYMSGEVTHHQYYLSFAQKAGLTLSDKMVSRSKAALEEGDEHLNTIPLSQWDNLALIYQPAIAHANKQINGKSTWSLCEGVCAFKALAKHLVD